MQTIARLASVCLALVGAPHIAASGGSRCIEGVIATFRITNPVIKQGEKLKVATTYHNTGYTTVHFPFMDPSHFSEIFRKGECEPLQGYYMGTPAVWEVILKPLESVELDEEVDLTAWEGGVGGPWEHLSPGDYEIQFYFHLGMLPDEIQGKYQTEYPYAHISLVIPWSDQRYPFTIAK